MAIDSMNKVIHAAVRRDLARLQAALVRVADGDRSRAARLSRAWGNLQAQLQHHHTQEDTILFPVVIHLGVDAALVEALESEHEEMGRALADIDSAMRSYASTGSAVGASQAAREVRRGTAVVEQHLVHEEGDLDPFLLKHQETPEWQAAMRQVRRQSPRRAGWFFAWLEDGAHDDVMAYLRAEVPRPVRFVLGRVFGRGYHRRVAPAWR